jgi:antitoxin CptB
MDLILGPYADGPAAELAPDALEAFEQLLEEEDLDLYRWVSGQAPAPPHLEPAIGRIRSHHGIA